MANAKISELDAITSTGVATDDEFALVDTSGGKTMRITADELRKFIMGTQGVTNSSMTFTSTGAATAIQPRATEITYQLVADSNHSGTSVVSIQGSNDNSNWVTLGTISVTGASDTDGVHITGGWAYVRGNCTTYASTSPLHTLTLVISY